MQASHVRLIKILFVIIAIKLFIVLVLFGYNNSVEDIPEQSMVFIDELLVDKSDGRSQCHDL